MKTPTMALVHTTSHREWSGPDLIDREWNLWRPLRKPKGWSPRRWRRAWRDGRNNHPDFRAIQLANWHMMLGTAR